MICFQWRLIEYVSVYIINFRIKKNNIINHSVYTDQISQVYNEMLFNIFTYLYTYLYTCILYITEKKILSTQHDIRSFNKWFFVD